MARAAKPLAWLHGEVKTPPFSLAARVETGVLLRRLQSGETPSLPHARPLPVIASRCHELRINDENCTWRIIVRVDPDAILILEVFSKKTQTTPVSVIEACRRRLSAYDHAKKGGSQ